jgi:hypothetical protein
MTLAQQEEKFIPGRIAKLKEFDASDPKYADKLHQFIDSYNYISELFPNDSETKDKLLHAFIENTFPDKTSVPAPPSVPQFRLAGTTTGRYASTGTNLRDIPLPPPITELPGVDIRKVLGFVILNKTTERLSDHFASEIFSTHERARTRLHDFLTDEQGLSVFGTGSAMRNYEIVPVSKNEMT